MNDTMRAEVIAQDLDLSSDDDAYSLPDFCMERGTVESLFFAHNISFSLGPGIAELHSVE